MDDFKIKLQKLLSTTYPNHSSFENAMRRTGLNVPMSREDWFELIKAIMIEKLQRATDRQFSSVCSSILYTLSLATKSISMVGLDEEEPNCDSEEDFTSQSARPKRSREDQTEAETPKKKPATSNGRQFMKTLLDQCKIRKDSMQERVGQNMERFVPSNSLESLNKYLIQMKRETLVSKARAGYALFVTRQLLGLKSIKELVEEMQRQKFVYSKSWCGKCVRIYERIRNYPLLFFAPNYTTVRQLNKATLKEIDDDSSLYELCHNGFPRAEDITDEWLAKWF